LRATVSARPRTEAIAAPDAAGSVASAFDEDRRVLAAQQLPREIGRYVHHELHVAARERGACTRLVVLLAREAEVAAVLHRGEVAARELALVGRDQRGRKVSRDRC
jgi:hypothetical protein